MCYVSTQQYRHECGQPENRHTLSQPTLSQLPLIVFAGSQDGCSLTLTHNPTQRRFPLDTSASAPVQQRWSKGYPARGEIAATGRADSMIVLNCRDARLAPDLYESRWQHEARKQS